MFLMWARNIIFINYHSSQTLNFWYFKLWILPEQTVKVKMSKVYIPSGCTDIEFKASFYFFLIEYTIHIPDR